MEMSLVLWITEEPESVFEGLMVLLFTCNVCAFLSEAFHGQAFIVILAF